MGAFSYRLSMDMREGKVVFIWMSSNSSSERIFLGGVDLLPYTRQMRLIPSLVQDDKKAYLKGADLLETLLQEGIQVLVSHDPQDRIERILNEKNSLSENLY